MITCPKCGIEYSGAERFCPKDGTRLGTGEGQISKIPSIAPGGDALINRVIQGRYKVLRQIGEGGMGVVYEAEHIEIEKKVALKVLRDDFSKRPEVVARFRQEAKSAGKIGNDHIVDVTDFGQLENGGVYFVMEYLQGRGLNEVIQNEKIEVGRGIGIILQIARALKAAHKIEIVHRDLKPENIFLIEKDEEKEFVKILDFGIAKISDRDSEGQRLTKTGMIFGTPEYMSPEQAAGKALDQRVDIYALGCIMFEIFTGRVPFEGETFMAILTQHMFEPTPKIEEVDPSVIIPEEIKNVVYKAMSKEKEDRYTDMIELAEELENAAIELGIIERDRSTNSRIREFKYIRKKKKEKKYKFKVLKIAIIVLFFISIGTAVYFRNWIADTFKKGENEKGRLEIQESVGKEDKRKISEKNKNSEEEKSDKEKEIGNEEDKKKVQVRIKTINENVSIKIEEMGIECKEKICLFDLIEGKNVKIKAISEEGIEKEVEIVPDENKNEIEIEFPKKNKRIKRHSKQEKTQKNDPTNEDGLKIPNIFQNN